MTILSRAAMFPRNLLLIVACSLPAYFTVCFSQQTPGALAAYLDNQDRSYKCQNYKFTKAAGGTFYEADFVSQTWQNIVWNHRLIVYIPEHAIASNALILVLRHIYNRNADFASLKILSDSANPASAVLYDIPNQPLFNGKEVDDLQAYTFSEYLKSGDESWPLLFPMVKSVVRAMDAIQYLAMKENKVAISRFLISGHSKRGHTTWLTAAVDTRVIGIIPMAIDILNSKQQLPHHLEVFGEYSTPSRAATDLLNELNHPRAQKLVEMVDAFSYRRQLRLPKLIVSATNDQFFAVDALNLYCNDLQGPKWILYLSNATHITAYSDQRINATAFAFIRAVASDHLLPRLTWEFNEAEEGITVKITADKTAAHARVWMASSQKKDFRRSGWVSGSMHRRADLPGSERDGISSKVFEMKIKTPSKGFMAVFAELEFVQEGQSFLLSSQVFLSKGR